MKIALDAMGGDFAPQATVEGAVLAARELKLSVVLVGPRDVVQKELAEHDVSGLDLTIEHAPEVVTMDDSPIEAMVTKSRSSIHLCYQLLRRGDVDAAISAGNSGAMMTIGIALLGNLPGIDRPAIALMVPTIHGSALLIDAGANTEAKPLNLVQFAVMGSAYMRHLRGLAAPKVGILANGEEDSKGDELTRTAAEMLAQIKPHINYIGYVEGRDINHGKADIVVTDGFTGNVALKTMEGFAKFMMANLRDTFAESWRGRLSYLLVRKQMRAMRERFDPSEYGGAPLLGISGRAFIAHCSSEPRAIRNALRAAGNESLDAVNHEIVELLGKISVTVPVRAAGKGFRAIFGRMRDRLQRRGKEIEDGAGGPAAGVPVAGGVRARTGPLLNGGQPRPDDSDKPSGTRVSTASGERPSEKSSDRDVHPRGPKDDRS